MAFNLSSLRSIQHPPDSPKKQPVFILQCFSISFWIWAPITKHSNMAVKSVGKRKTPDIKSAHCGFIYKQSQRKAENMVAAAHRSVFVFKPSGCHCDICKDHSDPQENVFIAWLMTEAAPRYRETACRVFILTSVQQLLMHVCSVGTWWKQKYFSLVQLKQILFVLFW